MVKIKATTSFAGVVNMRKGEERECERTDAIENLIKCGYVSVIKDRKKAAASGEEGVEGNTNTSNTEGGEGNEAGKSE